MIDRKEFVRETFKNIRMPAYLISEEVGYVEYTLEQIIEELSEKFTEDDDDEWCELISGIRFLTMFDVVSNEKDRFLRHIKEDEGITLEDILEQFRFSYDSDKVNNHLFTLVVGTLVLEHKIYEKNERFYTHE